MKRIFKPILNTDGSKTNYEISNYGEVINIKTGKFLSITYIDYTYQKGKRYKLEKPRPVVSIKIDGKWSPQLVYRLEMIVFKPIKHPEKYEVDHLDGDPLNNYIDNLEWVTSDENKRRAKEKRLLRHDENHPNSVYSDKLIHNICKDKINGLSRKEIMIKYEVNGQLIDDICSGRSHKYISELYIDKGFKYKEKLSEYEIKKREKLVKKICKYIEKGYSNREIYEKLKLPENEKCLPNDIRKHRVYKYISKEYNF